MVNVVGILNRIYLNDYRRKEIMRYFETEIGGIINKNFDSRMEFAVFTFIMNKGTDNLKDLSDEQIDKMPHVTGNFISKDFFQALVKTAVKICKECSTLDIMEYICCYLSFEPQTRELTIYKEDFSNGGWNEIICALSLEKEDVGKTIDLLAIFPKNK